MNVSQYASYALATAHKSLAEVMADVTAEEAAWTPPGVANPIGALYLHTAYDVDVAIHRLFQDKPPLWEAEGWGEKLGTTIDLDLSLEWARALRLDLDAAREYARRVFRAADEYVATLGEADFDRVIPSGMGESTTLGQLLQAFVIWHVDAHCGEISALKGVLGLKGYLF